MYKTLDTPYVKLELQDDLLIGIYKKGLKINPDIAKEIVKTRQEFTGPQPVVALIYNQGVISVEKKARDYLSSDEGAHGIIAAAYILDNPFSSFMANFIISVSKTKMPVRTFARKEAALKWLQQFRKQLTYG
jgi:hypothetical protein